MAMRSSGTAFYYRSANFPSANSFSACGFSVLRVDTNAYSVFFELQASPATSWHTLEGDDTGTEFIYADNTQSPQNIGTLTVGTPFFWGITKSSSTVRVFFRNLTTQTMTIVACTGGTGLTPAHMTVSGSYGFSETFNGAHSGIKIWDAVLSDAEMVNESNTLLPKRTANLHLWSPMIHAAEADCRTDFSGNGKNWSINGSPTQEQGAPMAWGSAVALRGPGGGGVTLVHVVPDSDISAGTWTPSTGGTLFGTIDETSPDDADYDVNVNSGGGTFEVGLTSLTDPASSTDHSVSYRISGESGSLIVSLRQGAGTEIASWTHDAPLPASPTTFVQALSGAQADSITNYSDLRLRFEAVP